MPREVFVLVGSPAAGKTWVSDQLKNEFDVVEHDYYKNTSAYVGALANRAQLSMKPVLGNTPFGLSEIMGALGARGVKCTPVFIIETVQTLTERYKKREHRPIPQGHLTRQATYIERARDLGSFVGTSDEVLNHLKGKLL